MTGDPASYSSSMESCGTGGVLNRLGLGQRRDRIELVKVSTASSCLGGAFATAPIIRLATQGSPEQGPQTGGGTAVAAPECSTRPGALLPVGWRKPGGTILFSWVSMNMQGQGRVYARSGVDDG
jgi:hypothetical protein